VFPTSLRSTAQRPMDVGFGKGQTSTLNFRHRMTSSSRWVSSAVQRWVSTGTVRWTRPMRPAERLLRPCSSEYVSLVLQCAGKFAQDLPFSALPSVARRCSLAFIGARAGGLLPRAQASNQFGLPLALLGCPVACSQLVHPLSSCARHIRHY